MNYISLRHLVGVRFPYDEELIAKLKSLDGEWHPYGEEWLVRIEHEALARQACLDCIGSDGLQSDFVDLHFCLTPGTVIEEPRWSRNLDICCVPIARLAGYKVLVGPNVDIQSGVCRARKSAVNDWRVGYQAPTDAHGFIVCRSIARTRAEAVLAKAASGALALAWPAIVDVRISAAT